MRSFKSIHSSLYLQGPVWCQTEQEVTKFLLSGRIDGWMKRYVFITSSLVSRAMYTHEWGRATILPLNPETVPTALLYTQMFHQPLLNPLCEKVGITKCNCVASSVFVLSFDKTSRMELKRVSQVTSPAQNLLILLIYLFLAVLGLLTLHTGFLFSCS